MFRLAEEEKPGNVEIKINEISRSESRVTANRFLAIRLVTAAEELECRRAV